VSLARKMTALQDSVFERLTGKCGMPGGM